MIHTKNPHNEYKSLTAKHTNDTKKRQRLLPSVFDSFVFFVCFVVTLLLEICAGRADLNAK
jgi:hypothetical protein